MKDVSNNGAQYDFSVPVTKPETEYYPKQDQAKASDEKEKDHGKK